MSMSPEKDDFEQLRRLLALKRHEAPPPRYFNEFSMQVIARIKAGERGRTLEPYDWFQRLWEALDTRPALAGAFGAAVCALLIGGVIYSEGVAPGPVAPILGERQPSDLSAEAATRPAVDGLVDVSGTNGTIPQPLGDSLFGSIRLPTVTPAAMIITSDGH
jgi:hypothetical protein